MNRQKETVSFQNVDIFIELLHKASEQFNELAKTLNRIKTFKFKAKVN